MGSTVLYYNAFYKDNDTLIEQSKGYDLAEAVEDAVSWPLTYAFTLEIDPEGGVRRISLDDEIKEYRGL